MGSTIVDCRAEGIRELYQRAGEHLLQARRNLEKGKREEAVAEARIARNLFDRIREICAR